MNILSIHDLNKSFGEHKVIDNLTFSVPEHAIYGFLGQNGAGKTTTMKMVLGLLKPASGKIEVCNETVSYGETKTNRQIGFLPDVPEFYGYLRPTEYLTLCGEITGLERSLLKQRVSEVLSLVGLEKLNKKIGGFSRGMKQRLGIAQALLNEPRLLICDEPTSALDPMGRKEILDILSDIKSTGKTTILFSTHILSDVERICDHIAILHEGKLALDGTLSEIKSKRRHDSVLIEFASAEDKTKFLQNAEVASLSKNIEAEALNVVMKAKDVAAAQEAIFHIITSNKIYPLKIEVLEPTLESLFLEVVK